MTESKPLNWTAADVGYSVIRRGDGGMTLTFTDLSDATLTIGTSLPWNICLAPTAAHAIYMIFVP